MGRACAITLLVAVAVLVGCSRERPPGGNDQNLPTLNLTDDLQVEVSPTYRADDSAQDVEDRHCIMIPDSTRGHFRPRTDILYTIVIPNMCTDSRVTVLNRVSGEPMLIESHAAGVACIPESDHVEFFLSAFDPHPMTAFIGPDGRICEEGGFGSSATIVNAPEGVLDLPFAYGTHVSAMTHDGERLWALLRSARQDSLLFMTNTGEVLDRKALRISWTSPTRAIAYSGDDVWIIHGWDTWNFGVLASDGSVTDLFSIDVAHDSPRRAQMAFANSKLWIADVSASRGEFASLASIDLPMSIQSGHVVFDHKVDLNPPVEAEAAISSDGGSFVVCSALGFLKRYAISGEQVDSLPMPVYAEKMAFDGEALWVAHIGLGNAAAANSEFLSRFYMR